MIEPVGVHFRTKAIPGLMRDLKIPAQERTSEKPTMEEAKDTIQPEASASNWLEALFIPDAEESPALPVFCEDPRSAQAKVVKTIGARFREARELCNMSQQRAAEALGYSNSSKLAKIEGASDTNSVPLYVIPRAAMLYGVSIDFIFGTVHDWEPSVDRDVSQWLMGAWESARRRDLEAIARLYRRVRSVSMTFDALMQRASDVSAALRTVRDRNDCFDELAAGNRLLCAVERQAEAVRETDVLMRRFRAELSGVQIPSARG